MLFNPNKFGNFICTVCAQVLVECRAPPVPLRTFRRLHVPLFSDARLTGCSAMAECRRSRSTWREWAPSLPHYVPTFGVVSAFTVAVGRSSWPGLLADPVRLAALRSWGSSRRLWRNSSSSAPFTLSLLVTVTGPIPVATVRRRLDTDQWSCVSSLTRASRRVCRRRHLPGVVVGISVIAVASSRDPFTVICFVLWDRLIDCYYLLP